MPFGIVERKYGVDEKPRLIPSRRLAIRLNHEVQSDPLIVDEAQVCVTAGFAGWAVTAEPSGLGA